MAAPANATSVAMTALSSSFFIASSAPAREAQGLGACRLPRVSCHLHAFSRQRPPGRAQVIRRSESVLVPDGLLNAALQRCPGPGTGGSSRAGRGSGPRVTQPSSPIQCRRTALSAMKRLVREVLAVAALPTSSPRRVRASSTQRAHLSSVARRETVASCAAKREHSTAPRRASGIGGSSGTTSTSCTGDGATVDRRIGYCAEGVTVSAGSDTGDAGDERSIDQPRIPCITLHRQHATPRGA